MSNQFDRQNLVLGGDSAARLAEKTVLICGLGGVGGHLLEALARTGIGHIAAADEDVFEPSNLNRQLLCTYETIGKHKTEAAAQRVCLINPTARFSGETLRLDAESIPLLLDKYRPDYVADAVDDTAAKVCLAVEAGRRGMEIISCMGAGNRVDPMGFLCADIYQTSVCPLAKTMRGLLKKHGVKRLKTVYSREAPSVHGGAVGSVSYVPAAAGLLMAAEIVKGLLKT